MRLSVTRVMISAAVMIVLSTAVQAQGVPVQPTRFDVGVSVMFSQPLGEFAQNVGNSLGAGGSLLYQLDRSGWLSARFDGSGLIYGHEKKSTRLSSTIPARVLADISTSNTIADVSIGPEVTIPRGSVHPYLNVAVSGLFFRTSSSLCCAQDGMNVLSTTNYKDNTRAWIYGAGFRFPIAHASIQPMIDLGVRYHRGGSVSYLREGSIQDNPDGSISFEPLSSRSNYMVYAVSFRFRIPYQSTGLCPRLLC